MTMTNEEIVRSYRTAKYPGKQISILAELNMTTPSAIRTILETEGCELPKRGRPKTAPEDLPRPEASPERELTETWDGEKILPAPEGAGDWPEPKPKTPGEYWAEAAAVEVIARLVADCDSSQDREAATMDLREQVRGVLALVYELRGGTDT